jgi:hypothetical protein
MTREYFAAFGIETRTSSREHQHACWSPTVHIGTRQTSCRPKTVQRAGIVDPDTGPARGLISFVAETRTLIVRIAANISHCRSSRGRANVRSQTKLMIINEFGHCPCKCCGKKPPVRLNQCRQPCEQRSPSATGREGLACPQQRNGPANDHQDNAPSQLSKRRSRFALSMASGLPATTTSTN